MSDDAAFDECFLSALADLTARAVSRQPAHIRDQLAAALAAGDVAMRPTAAGVAVDVDGRELMLVPYAAVALD